MGQDSHMKKKVMIMVEIEMEGDSLDRKVMTLIIKRISQKWLGFEVTAKRDEKTGQVINKVDMPEIPGVDNVLETAEKFYNFINTTKK